MISILFKTSFNINRWKIIVFVVVCVGHIPFYTPSIECKYKIIHRLIILMNKTVCIKKANSMKFNIKRFPTTILLRIQIRKQNGLGTKAITKLIFVLWQAIIKVKSSEKAGSFYLRKELSNDLTRNPDTLLFTKNE